MIPSIQCSQPGPPWALWAGAALTNSLVIIFDHHANCIFAKIQIWFLRRIRKIHLLHL